MDAAADAEQMLTIWTRLTTDQRRLVGRECGWSGADVDAVLGDPRRFYTTPIGDLEALADALGLGAIDFDEHADAAVASARAHASKRASRRADVERAAHSALNMIRDTSPPVDLDHLARRMGVDEVVRRPMEIDGRLLAGPDRIVVQLCSQRSYVRQRFTLAHELGHLWLSQNRVKSELPPLEWREEERFCNRFAAAILMPRTWIARRSVESTPNLRVLEQMSLEANTSLSATLIRAQDVDPRWSSSLIKFRPAPDEGWRIISITGLSHRLRYRLRCTPQTSTFLREAADSTELMTGELQLYLDGAALQIKAEAISSPRRVVLAFAQLPAAGRPTDSHLPWFRGAAHQTGRRGDLSRPDA